MKADTKLRSLTVEDSKTNKAFEIWQNMTPMQRYELSKNFSDISNIKKRQTACINHIEDSL